MSEELEKQVSDLTTENEALKKQATNNGLGVNALLAQIDAHKQKLNECLQIELNLRTNFILIQKQNKELSDKLALADKKLTELGA